jgi:predicted ATP-binding protein involved in virulence
VIDNPSSWLLDLDEPKFNAAARALRDLLMLSNQEDIGREKNKKGELEVLFKLGGNPSTLDQLSEGYKTVIATAVDVMREMLIYWPNLESASGLVLIDEIETHLHPRWKMRLVGALREAMPGIQFIFTTHDPLCLRGMFEGEVQVMSRDRETGAQNLKDLPNIEQLNVGQLLTSDFFGLESTEDPNLEKSLEDFVNMLTDPDVSKDELATTRQSLALSMGIGQTPHDQIMQEVMKFIQENQGNIKVDYKKNKEGLKKRALDIWESTALKKGI